MQHQVTETTQERSRQHARDPSVLTGVEKTKSGIGFCVRAYLVNLPVFWLRFVFRLARVILVESQSL